MAAGKPRSESVEHLHAELDRFKVENKRLVAERNDQANEIIDLKRTIKKLERKVTELIAPAILADIEAMRKAHPPQT